jgi:RimJ/RimL family protein N-acetyltransferase
VTWPTLRTGRLVLRPLAAGDLDDLSALHAQEAFWRYPLGRGVTRAETEQFIAQRLESYRAGVPAVSAVEVADTGELAGWAGLASPEFLPEILPAMEVGWRLGTQFWGRGYATEAGAAWLTYAFEELGLDEVVSVYEPANVASGAVMARLGLTERRRSTHPRLGVELVVTAIDRSTWAARREDGGPPT